MTFFFVRLDAIVAAAPARSRLVPEATVNGLNAFELAAIEHRGCVVPGHSVQMKVRAGRKAGGDARDLIKPLGGAP